MDQTLSDIKGVLYCVVLGLVGVLVFISVLTYFYFAKDISAKENILNRNDTGVILMDRNNKPFFTLYQAHIETYIPIDQIPKVTQNAIIAAEDKDFYSHPGFSPLSMIAALVADAKGQGLNYGGSTITQQLVKISLLNPQKSFLRKYQEVILAQELERKYSKSQILEMYLNSVYFGEGAFGVEQAAQVYFNKPAAQLNLSESAMLAAVLPAPSSLSPISGNFDKTKIRQAHVLDQMKELDLISADDREKAKNEVIKIQPKGELLEFSAPHFAMYVKDQLVKKYGEEIITRSGLKVRTSIDLNLQSYAEKILTEQVQKLTPNKVSNGAAVIIDSKTGEILAMVGSKDWNDSNFGKVNIVTSLRQPGSSFKPLVYAEALEKQVITPATILKDSAVFFPEDNNYASYNYKIGQNLYKPKNYDGKFRGSVTVRRALANSLNVPSVEVLSKLGVTEAVSAANNFGISNMGDPSQYGLSLVLGSHEVQLLELTSAYTVLANSGQKNPPTAILEIDDKFGAQVEKYKPQNIPVISAATAFLVSSILADKQTRGEIFGSALNMSREAAVKTGTTENYRDAITIGYTPQVTVGVWVGNNDGTQMDQVAGSLGAAPIWRNLMEYYLKDKPVEKFSRPVGVVEVPICKGSGLRLRSLIATSSASMEYFIQGTEPQKFCSIVKPSATPSASPV